MFLGSSWRKPKKLAARTKPRPQVKFIRVGAEVMRDKSKEVVKGRLMLSDLSPTGVGVFIQEPFTRGELVTIVIDHPKHVYVKGVIEFCGYYTMSTRVLSPESFAYRCYIKFIFDSAEEREALRKFVL